MSGIKDFLVNGLHEAYLEFCWLRLDDSQYHSKATEYLFTVNVAKKMIEWRSQLDNGYDYPIYLEYDADEFKANCFPNIVANRESPGDVFSKTVIKRRLPHSSSRNGRIDIAITKKPRSGWSMNNQSIYGIELKGINPSSSKILADFDRLAEVVNNFDPIDESSLEGCYLAFVKRLDKPKKLLEGTKIPRLKKATEDGVRKLIGKSKFYGSVNANIELFEISTYTAEDYMERTGEEWFDYSEAALHTGAIVSVIICISKQ